MTSAVDVLVDGVRQTEGVHFTIINRIVVFVTPPPKKSTISVSELKLK
jgi:hypothetical protein